MREMTDLSASVVRRCLRVICAAGVALPLALTTGPAGAQSMRDNKFNATEQADRNYEAMLRDSPAFLAKRIEMECGGIEDPDVRLQCLETFPKPAQKPPVAPSAKAPRR